MFSGSTLRALSIIFMPPFESCFSCNNIYESLIFKSILSLRLESAFFKHSIPLSISKSLRIKAHPNLNSILPNTVDSYDSLGKSFLKISSDS